jgi:hypothetical protein
MAGAKDIMYAFATGSACMGGALCLQYYVMRYHTRNKTTQKLDRAVADEAAQQTDITLAGGMLMASDGRKFILSEPITVAQSKVLGYVVSTIAHAWLLLDLYTSSPGNKQAAAADAAVAVSAT